MGFPDRRMRRLRKTDTLRRMVRETKLSVDDLIYPMFVTFGQHVRNPIGSMPGNFQLSVDELVKECREVVDLGIKASSEAILEGLRKHGAQALGLSGLLVKSCEEMAVAADDLAHAGVHVPILAGGAALSARFVARKIAPRSSPS